tara:strand:- start:218 stop:943 length:726 start_codon:yes stop_codon:yes gene_type:complete
MVTSVRIIAQHYDTATGEILESSTIRDEVVTKPDYLKDLGYLHMDQIDIISKCQDFKISHQINLFNDTNTCPIFGSKAVKHGKYNSEFHAIFSDHMVNIQRLKCKNGCTLPYKLEGIFGSSTHPDLLKKQAELMSDKSYVKASKYLNYDSLDSRAINNRTHLSRVGSMISNVIETIRTEDKEVKDIGVKELISTIDGGHIKSRGDGRSFEAMVAAVYRPESIKRLDKKSSRNNKQAYSGII